MSQIDLFGNSADKPTDKPTDKSKDKSADKRKSKPVPAFAVAPAPRELSSDDMVMDWKAVVAPSAAANPLPTPDEKPVLEKPAVEQPVADTRPVELPPKRARAPRAPRAEAVVLPAPTEPGLAALARQLPPSLRMGTSSWSFPGWAGLVYGASHPESLLSRSGLSAYARHPLLRCAGVDRTFYAPLAAAEFAPLSEAVPEDFRFLVKAHAAVTMPFDQWRRMPYAGRTPDDRFLDPAYTADRVVAPAVEGLGDKLGVLLFQFPPLGAPFARTALRFADHLARFLEALPPLPVDANGRGPRYAIEVRNREFLGPAYAAALGARGVVHCLNVHPRMPSPTEQSRLILDGHAIAGIGARPPLTVVRWMLHPELEYTAARDSFEPFDRLAAPDPASREAVASEVAAALARQDEVIVIVNNKAEGSAPLTLRELATVLAERDSHP